MDSSVPYSLYDPGQPPRQMNTETPDVSNFTNAPESSSKSKWTWDKSAVRNVPVPKYEHKQEFMELTEYMYDLNKYLNTTNVPAYSNQTIQFLLDSPFSVVAVKFLYNKIRYFPTESWMNYETNKTVKLNLPKPDDYEEMLKVFYFHNIIGRRAILVSNYVIEKMIAIRVSGVDIMSVLAEVQLANIEGICKEIFTLMANIGQNICKPNVVQLMQTQRDFYSTNIKLLHTRGGSPDEFLASFVGFSVTSSLWYLLNPEGATGYLISKVRKVSLLPPKKQRKRWESTELSLFGLRDNTKLDAVFRDIAKALPNNGVGSRKLRELVQRTYKTLHVFAMFLDNGLEFLELIIQQKGVIGTHFNHDLITWVTTQTHKHMKANSENPYQILVNIFESIIEYKGHVNFYGQVLQKLARLLELIFGCVTSKWYDFKVKNSNFHLPHDICWDFTQFISEIQHNCSVFTGEKKQLGNYQPSEATENTGTTLGIGEFIKTVTHMETPTIQSVNSSTLTTRGRFLGLLGGAAAIGMGMAVGAPLWGAAAAGMAAVGGMFMNYHGETFDISHNRLDKVWDYCDSRLQEKIANIAVLDGIPVSLYRRYPDKIVHGIDSRDLVGTEYERYITDKLHSSKTGYYKIVNLLGLPTSVYTFIRLRSDI
jgi:hypothetical protein